MDNDKRDRRLWELTRKLVCLMIPFHPPLKGILLESLKKNNPKGYAVLEEYLFLEQEEIAQKGYPIQVHKINDFGYSYWVTEYVTLEEKERIEKERKERRG
jgi:hypothetical protein